jgi:hypothetical protein
VTTAAQLLTSLESSGWTVELIPAGRGVGGLATKRDGGDAPLRLTAWALDRSSVILLLFEQASARLSVY